jgi:RES domain-containing protein
MATKKIFRIQKPKHNPTTLSGKGAKDLGGRWNHEGTPLVYTSTSTSLCILELRVHLGVSTLDKFPPLNIVELELPEEYIHEFALSELPDGWDSIPAPECCHLFLAPFLEPGNKLAFSVPSVVNPLERNILINPLHSDIGKVIIRQFHPFTMDSRLFLEMID